MNNINIQSINFLYEKYCCKNIEVNNFIIHNWLKKSTNFPQLMLLYNQINLYYFNQMLILTKLFKCTKLNASTPDNKLA